MSKGVNPIVLDNGLNHIKVNCDLIAAVVSYTPGTTTYAQAIQSANVVAQVPMVDADLVISDGTGGSRMLTSASKVDSNTNVGNPTHFLLLDTVNQIVLAWTDETSTTEGILGGSLRIPAIVLTAAQPV